MHSDTNNTVEIDRDAFDELMDQSEPVEPREDDGKPDFMLMPEFEQPIAAPSIPNLRFQLNAFRTKIAGLRDHLAHLDATKDISPAGRMALASIAAGQRIPADNIDDPVLRKWYDQSDEQLLRFRSMALEEIDAQIEIVNKAQVSLQTLDAFDKSALPIWSNLPPQKLTRAINAHAHLVFSNAIVR